MKKLFHLCVSSPKEVLFRSEEDFIRAENYLALALYKTDSKLLADSFMSNHFHLAVQTENAGKFIQSLRISYNKYFNHKYLRSGILGDMHYFSTEIQGIYHTLAALSYIFRNPLHHGVASTPYEYNHSSVNCIFARQLGKCPSNTILTNRNEIRKHLPISTPFPQGYKMNSNGIILRESYLETSQVELLYSTPRAFMYYMNRLSTEEWTKEQEKDKNGLKSITIDLMEQGTGSSIQDLLRNEKGRFQPLHLQDTEVCELIQNRFLRMFKKSSYTMLTTKEKEKTASILINDFGATAKQAARCLALDI